MKKEETKVHLIKSETWLNANFEEIHSVLEDTVKDFVENERIINIQVVKDDSGLSRFWIYLEPTNKLKK